MCSNETLNEIIYEKRWDELLTVECIEKKEFICEKCKNKHSILHKLCLHNPPIEVLKYMGELNSSSFSERDCQNRLPLHIALINGSKIEEIIYLLSKNKTAASFSDMNGSYPIHLLVKNPKLSYRLHRKPKQSINVLRVVKFFCKTAPESMVAEDINGCSPIEYAINVEQDIQIIDELRYRSSNYQKKCSRAA